MTIGLTAANAAKAFLEAQDLDTDLSFYAEIESAEIEGETTNSHRELPCVICYTSAKQEYPPRSGNFNIQLHLRLIASADDLTAEDFDTLQSAVFSAINTDTIIADLTSASVAASNPFHAFGFWEDVQESNQTIEGRNRAVEMILPINCCAKTIAAS